jgi:hypothetical protein
MTVANRGAEARLRQVQRRCDKVFRAFEAVREAQLAARAAVETALAAPEPGPMLAEAWEAVTALHAAIEHARAVWESNRPSEALDDDAPEAPPEPAEPTPEPVIASIEAEALELGEALGRVR